MPAGLNLPQMRETESSLRGLSVLSPLEHHSPQVVHDCLRGRVLRGRVSLQELRRLVGNALCRQSVICVAEQSAPPRRNAGRIESTIRHTKQTMCRISMIRWAGAKRPPTTQRIFFFVFFNHSSDSLRSRGVGRLPVLVSPGCRGQGFLASES